VWFSINLFTLIVGLTEMIATIGGGLSIVFLSKAIKFYDWRNIFIYCSIFTSILLIYSIIFVKDKVKKKEESKKQSFIIKNLLIVLKNKNAWKCGIFAGILFSPIVTIGCLWGEPFLMSKYNFKIEKSTSIISMVFIGVALGSPIIAYFSREIGIPRIIMISGTLMVLLFISLGLYIQIVSVFYLHIVFFLIGFFLLYLCYSFFDN